MTHSEIAQRRTNAIKFYGQEEFSQIIRIAERYMRENNIAVPSEGVTSMPSFWLTVDELIREHSN